MSRCKIITRKRRQMEPIVVSDNDENEPDYHILLNDKKYAVQLNVIREAIIKRIKAGNKITMQSAMTLCASIMADDNLPQPSHVGIIGITGRGYKTYLEDYVKWGDIDDRKVIICLILHIEHFSLCVMNGANYFYLPLFDKTSLNADCARKTFDEFLRYLIREALIDKYPKNANKHIIFPSYPTFWDNNCGSQAAIFAAKLTAFAAKNDVLTEVVIKDFIETLKPIFIKRSLKQRLLEIMQQQFKVTETKYPPPKSFYEPAKKKQKLSIINDAKLSSLSLRQTSDAAIYCDKKVDEYNVSSKSNRNWTGNVKYGQMRKSKRNQKKEKKTKKKKKDVKSKSKKSNFDQDVDENPHHYNLQNARHPISSLKNDGNELIKETKKKLKDKAKANITKQQQQQKEIIELKNAVQQLQIRCSVLDYDYRQYIDNINQQHQLIVEGLKNEMLQQQEKREKEAKAIKSIQLKYDELKRQFNQLKHENATLLETNKALQESKKECIAKEQAKNQEIKMLKATQNKYNNHINALNLEIKQSRNNLHKERQDYKEKQQQQEKEIENLKKNNQVLIMQKDEEIWSKNVYIKESKEKWTELEQEYGNVISLLSEKENRIKMLSNDNEAKDGLLCELQKKYDDLTYVLNDPDHCIGCNKERIENLDKYYRRKLDRINSVREKYNTNTKLWLRFRDNMRRPSLLPARFIFECKSINLEKLKFISPDNEWNIANPVPNRSSVEALLIYAWDNCVSWETKEKMYFRDLEYIYMEWCEYYELDHQREKEMDERIDRRNKESAINLSNVQTMKQNHY